MTRPLEERSAQIWRAIGAAGKAGIGSTALHDKFRNVIDGTIVSSRLQTLLNGGYIARSGENRWGMWLLDRRCKLPEGETWPVWVFEQPDADDEAAADWQRSQGKAEVKLPAAPASAFNVAKTAGIELPAEPELSLRQQIAKKTTVAAMGTFKSPLEAMQAVAAQRTEPVANTEPITFPAPSGDCGKALSITEEGGEDFRCYVDSDGETYIYSNGEEIELPIEHTRKLMKYYALINAASMLVEPAGAAS
jgi:hypothetical protein